MKPREQIIMISLFYHNVTVLDYAYLDEHLGLVGDSVKVNVEFLGHTDSQGIIYDFGHAKKKVKEIIDEHCDHRLVAPKHLVQKGPMPQQISLQYSYGLEGETLKYECPEEAVFQIPIPISPFPQFKIS